MDFTADVFTPHVGDTFRVVAGETAVETRLRDVDVVGGPNPATGRVPFSIVFIGPLEPVLPQAIYPIEHEALGPLEIFIVPIGPDEDGMRYEAVFG